MPGLVSVESTGRVATPDQAQEVHGEIRKCINGLGLPGDDIRILYGGSVKPDNVSELMGMTNVDGALVGGASLTADSFLQIIQYR